MFCNNFINLYILNHSEPNCEKELWKLTVVLYQRDCVGERWLCSEAKGDNNAIRCRYVKNKRKQKDRGVWEKKMLKRQKGSGITES